VGNELELREAASRDRLSVSGRRMLQRPDTSQWIEHDVWLSEKRKGTYAYHWERRGIDGTIYRHNNLPDPHARALKTFPKHFHDGSEQTLAESSISNDPEDALRDFLSFVRRKIT